MKWNNGSSFVEFLLLGLTEDPVVKIVLFLLFFVMYVITFIGNALLITACVFDPCRHNPMYFFLVNLSMLDIFLSTFVSCMLAQLPVRRSISFIACVAQMYFSLFLAATECGLLAVMAYDRYVTIIASLGYTVIMTASACITLVASCWLIGSMLESVGSFVALRFPLCGSKIINHFMCEATALLKIACVDIFVIEMLIFGVGICALLLPNLFIAISYTHIITIMKIRSSKARSKAFSAHLIVVRIK